MSKLSHKIYTQQTLKIFNATHKNKDSFGILPAILIFKATQSFEKFGFALLQLFYFWTFSY